MSMTFVIPIVLFLVCYFTGDLICLAFSIKQKFALKCVLGYLFLTAAFHILSIPFMYFEMMFTPLYYSFIGLIILLLIGYLFISIRKKQFGLKIDFYEMITNVSLKKLAIIGWVVFGVLLIYQLYMIYHYVLPNVDDQFYVSQTTTMLFRNRIMDIMPSSGEGLFEFPDMYKMVSFEILIGVVSKFFGIGPAVLCHSILPLFLVPLSYMAFYLVGREINEKNNYIFMIFIALINIFSGFSNFSQGAFLILRVWQGKAMMVNFLFPILLFAFIKIMKERKVTWKYILFLTGILVCGFHMTTVGIVFLPLSYAVYAFVVLLYIKKVKEFLKLFIPALLILPLVIQRVIILFSQSDVEEFSEGVDKLVYSSVLYDMAGESHFILLLIVSMILLLFVSHKRNKFVLVLYPVLVTLIYLNPYFSEFIATRITGVAVYWRVFWLLQYGVTMAAGLSLVPSMVRKKSVKVILIILCAWIIVFSGSTLFTLNRFPKGAIVEDFSRDKKVYTFLNPSKLTYMKEYDPMSKLNLFSVKTADIINEIKDEEGMETPKLFITEARSRDIRQYADINLVWFKYVKSYYLKAGLENEWIRLENLYNALYNNKRWDKDVLLYELRHFEVDFIVLKVSSLKRNEVPEVFEKLFEDGTYVLYRIGENKE